MNVLVVDDEKFNLTVAKDLIASSVEDSEIFLCSRPEDVMLILEQEDIGVILLDIIMPRMDGITVLKTIRQEDRFQDIQIVMFTGVSDKESFRLCFELGANDYINKPIDPIEFTVRIRAAVKSRNSLLRLKQVQEYLVQAEKLTSLGELAAGIAHEINNPIGYVASNLDTLEKYIVKLAELLAKYREFGQGVNALLMPGGDLTLLLQKLVEREKREKLEYILTDIHPLMAETRSGIDRVSKIVSSLRSFAKTGNSEEVALNNVNLIVEEALIILKSEIEAVARLEIYLNPLNPVKCDKGQILQVFVNILQNAVHAIQGQKRDTPGLISITTAMIGNFIQCEIVDDGPGIKQEHLNRIFDPFFTTKEIGSGAGLGLSISYGIVKKYAGELLAESIFGQGVKFIVKLPSVR